MIGLKIEIDKRKRNHRTIHNSSISVPRIASILNTNYNYVNRKLNKGTFTVEEAIKIFSNLEFNSKDKFDALEYLFTDQDGV